MARLYALVMAVTRMRFVGSGDGTSYIDLAKAISLQERKLHRQKKVYTVYGGFFVDTPASDSVSRIDINTAPNTWVARTAVNRGFRKWKRMISETLKNAPGVKPGKYNDFKVFLNNSHGSTPLLPKDAEGNDLYTGAPEWDYSTLTSAEGAEDANGVRLPADQFDLNIVGPSNTAALSAANAAGWTRVGLIHDWLISRPQVDGSQPDASPLAQAHTSPLALMFDAGETNDERIIVIEAEGDQPPYDEDSMFGMVNASNTASHNLQRQSVATTTITQPTAPVHGFQALCGLLQIDVIANGAWELVLDVETVGEDF